jgi:hypothetical protein
VELFGGRAEEYDFETSYEFLTAAASIATPDSAVRFVARYGLAFLAVEREDPDAWAKELRHLTFGEPVADYLALGSELREIRRLYRLSQAVARGDEQKLPEVVADSINSALERSDGRFWTGMVPGSGIVIRPASPTLAGQAWLQVAIEALQKLNLRECEVCGAVFAVTDPRKRFCTPRCSGRTRSRRFRQSHRLIEP